MFGQTSGLELVFLFWTGNSRLALPSYGCDTTLFVMKALNVANYDRPKRCIVKKNIFNYIFNS